MDQAELSGQGGEGGATARLGAERRRWDHAPRLDFRFFVASCGRSQRPQFNATKPSRGNPSSVRTLGRTSRLHKFCQLVQGYRRV